MFIFAALIVSATVDLVTDCGAVANNNVDDAPAFNTCIASAGNGGKITVPSASTFDMARVSASLGAGLIAGVDGLTVECADASSVFKMKFANPTPTGDFYMFYLHNSDRITFSGCTFDGNRGYLTSADEQTHLVEVYDSRHVVFESITFRNAWGDGVKVIGSAVSSGVYATRDIEVRDSHFLDNGRGGVGLQSTADDVRIVRSDFWRTSDQAIDFEPSGQGLRNVLVDHVLIGPSATDTYALTLSGGTTSTTKVTVRDSQVYGGGIHSTGLEDARLERVTVVSSRPCITSTGRLRDFTVVDSTFTCNGYGIQMAAVTSTASPGGVSLLHNTWTITAVASGAVMYLDGGGPGGYLIAGNDAWTPNGSSSFALYFRDTFADGIDVRGVTVVDNRLIGFKYGIALNGSYGNVSDVLIDGNTVETNENGSYGTWCESPFSNVRRGHNIIRATYNNSGCP